MGKNKGNDIHRSFIINNLINVRFRPQKSEAATALLPIPYIQNY